LLRGSREPRVRGALADAEANDKIYLFKKSSTLRATYQVRLLLFRAVQEGRRLILVIPQHCELSASLQSLLEANPELIGIERR